MKKPLILIAVVFIFIFRPAYAQPDKMYAHYINVGQGSATLLEFPCGAVLIDAGGENNSTRDHLTDYLNDFFIKRADLNRTLDLVIVTHAHKDHNMALLTIADQFTVKNYVDNSKQSGGGTGDNQKKMQDRAKALGSGIIYGGYTFEQIIKNGNQKGLTNPIIDPIDCGDIDPQIILYSGGFKYHYEPWSDEEYGNPNNNSLFIKVKYGDASFLFIGDGETAEMNTVTEYYWDTDALDADVLLVGHHGAVNATTDSFLHAVSPRYAIISCGDITVKKTGATAYSYSHPRIEAIELLEKYIPGNRAEVRTKSVGLGKKEDKVIDIRKRIYATPWDQDIVIRASLDGKYKAVYTK